MKKFLLIIAVATAGLIPQLALCEPPGFGEAVVSGPLLMARLNNPGIDLQEAAQSALRKPRLGQTGGYTVQTLDCGRIKIVPNGTIVDDKVFAGEGAGTAAPVR